MTRRTTDGGSPIRTIPIAQPRISKRELRAVERVLRSGRLRAGPIVEDFEARFARAVGAKFAVAVSSGTAGLFLAYRTLLQPGDEIIVPDFTFVATASMAVAAGLRPVFADVHPETFTLDPAQVERRITRRTRAIAPVHLYGHPADVSALMRLARRHDLRVIWDAAQAHGAAFRGRDVGSLPDVVCYSFYPSKNMTTGEGGMLTTSSLSLATELRLLRSHGEESRYHHIRLGFNFRLTEFAAALGREQLRRLPGEVRARRRNAAALTRGLASLGGLKTPIVAPGAAHAFNLFTVRINPTTLSMSRDAFQAALARQGIETAVHYPVPLHRQPIFRGHGTDRDFPVSTRLAKTVLSLPIHPGLTHRELDRIIRAVRELSGAASKGLGGK
ncbi:MAG TPA: DegT/DnrJ/EryC1/StrS family aminotransferase [Terriglobia bacterium]|nr:DegT/DnrJ/EryC1/StrS family aminotransferase [Terriglobia bacterium]